MRALKPVGITVYLDMFFLVNFLMDLLLLNLMKHFMKLPGGGGRIAAAAALGAGGACALLCLQLWMPPYIQAAALLLILAEHVGVPVSMILAAFGKSSGSILGKRLAVLWLLAAVMGGILSAADGPAAVGLYFSGTMAVQQWKLLPLMFWAAGMYFALRAFGEQFGRWQQEQKTFCQVTLFYRGQCQTVTALWDTGNHLYEPYGHQPVHVITDEACRRLCHTVSQVVYIPFQAVGTGYGLLPGIRIDSMDVVRRGRPAAHYDRPWLAVCKGPLSVSRRYEMLLHGEELE